MAYDLNATTAYIREAARRRGIDPDIAVRVARSEGLARGTWQSNLSKGGRREPSYGPFQFLVGGEGTGYPTGMGNDFKRDTGLDPSDPRNVNATIDYAMDRAAKEGWGAWYGAGKAGIGRRDGIGVAKPAGGSPLVDAVAARGGGQRTVVGDAGNDRLEPQAAGSTSNAPTVDIGLPPDLESQGELYDALVKRGMQMGGNAQNLWDVAGGLAQVWAGTSEKKKLDDVEAQGLKGVIAGMDPEYRAAAQLLGGREGAAKAYLAQMDAKTTQAQRSEAQAWRQDERDYQRGRDAESDRRWQAEQERLAQGTVPAGYRRTETGMEAVPGGPADPAVARADFKPSIQTVYDDQGREQKGYFDQTGNWTTMGGPKAPSSSGGVTISPDGTVQIGGAGAKVPSGFQPDPDNPGAVKPIPGGPGEQISGELAARLGLASKFIENAPALRKRLGNGDASGPIDVFQARNIQQSEPAEVHRQLEYGVEALVRMLTGAGMNMAEAEERARRYLPTYTDNAESMVKKLDGLTENLIATRDAAMRGRGGAPGGVLDAKPPTDGQRPAEAAPIVPGSDVGADMPPPNRANGAPLDYRTRYGLE